MDQLQSEMLSGNAWVHNFIEEEFRKDIETKTQYPGIKSFTVNNCMQVFKGDYILKWSEDGVHKTIYLVTSIEPQKNSESRRTVGIMKDLIAVEEFDSEAMKAIEKGDFLVARSINQ